MKKNIAVFFGGNSPERDISVITGLQAMGCLDRKRYNVYPIYIDGYELRTGAELSELKSYGERKIGKEAAFFGNSLLEKRRGGFRKVAEIDCALLCTHGGSGENGGLQGFLETQGIPYTSSGVEQSAVLMNKLTAKKLFAAMKIKQVPYIGISKSDFKEDPDGAAEAIIKKIPLPLIVKPASLGSSIGIKTAETAEELSEALEIASEYDESIVIEKKLEDFVEVNCAAVRKNGGIVISAIEKPLCWESFLTFDDKYSGGGKMAGAERELPASIPPKQSVEVRAAVEKIYAALGLFGVVRADFLIDKSGSVFINEVNTIPGSLAFYLFEENGVSYASLLDIMIEEAEKRKDDCEKLKRYYDSDVLERFKSGGLSGKKLQK